jgi:hypothetical protein
MWSRIDADRPNRAADRKGSPHLYGGTERVVSHLTEELGNLHFICSCRMLEIDFSAQVGVVGDQFLGKR